jgi:hypothetical protein
MISNVRRVARLVYLGFLVLGFLEMMIAGDDDDEGVW